MARWGPATGTPEIGSSDGYHSHLPANFALT